MVVNRTSGGSIYRLKVSIKDIRPPVWRRIEVPAEVTLAGLHDVLQTAVGWTDSHLHQFDIGDTLFGRPDPDDRDWGLSVRDERRGARPGIVGGARALEIICTGRELDAAEMERLGLVLAVHPGDRLLAEARALAQRIAESGPLATRGAKRSSGLPRSSRPW